MADGVTFTSVFKPGQVLIERSRAYQRKVAATDFAGVCSGDIYVLESQDADALSPELLPFILESSPAWRWGIKNPGLPRSIQVFIIELKALANCHRNSGCATTRATGA